MKAKSSSGARSTTTKSWPSSASLIWLMFRVRMLSILRCEPLRDGAGLDRFEGETLVGALLVAKVGLPSEHTRGSAASEPRAAFARNGDRSGAPGTERSAKRKRERVGESEGRSPSDEFGAPGRARTCNLWLRRPTLYPVELRAHENDSTRTTFSGAANRCSSRVRRTSEGWRARRDLNPRPTGSKPGALSN